MSFILKFDEIQSYEQAANFIRQYFTQYRKFFDNSAEDQHAMVAQFQEDVKGMM